MWFETQNWPELCRLPPSALTFVLGGRQRCHWRRWLPGLSPDDPRGEHSIEKMIWPSKTDDWCGRHLVDAIAELFFCPLPKNTQLFHRSPSQLISPPIIPDWGLEWLKKKKQTFHCLVLVISSEVACEPAYLLKNKSQDFSGMLRQKLSP